MKKEVLFLAMLGNAISISCSKPYSGETDPNAKKNAENTKMVAASASKAHLATDLLWDGDASKGISVFKDITLQANDLTYYNNTGAPSPNGSYFQAETDATEGTVWHSHKDDLDRRAEASHAVGVTPVSTTGGTYYIGYRFKLSKVTYYPSGDKYHIMMQWKTGGTPNLQNFPVLAVINSGKFVVQSFADGQISTDLFKHDVVANEWYSVVIKIKVGNTTSTGNVQVWWGNDATPETLLTGGTDYNCKTFDGTYVGPKWGYYGQTNLDGDVYYSRLKMGTTHDAVKPY